MVDNYCACIITENLNRILNTKPPFSCYKGQHIFTITQPYIPKKVPKTN